MCKTHSHYKVLYVMAVSLPQHQYAVLLGWQQHLSAGLSVVGASSASMSRTAGSEAMRQTAICLLSLLISMVLMSVWLDCLQVPPGHLACFKKEFVFILSGGRLQLVLHD